MKKGWDCGELKGGKGKEGKGPKKRGKNEGVSGRD